MQRGAGGVQRALTVILDIRTEKVASKLNRIFLTKKLKFRRALEEPGGQGGEGVVGHVEVGEGGQGQQ